MKVLDALSAATFSVSWSEWVHASYLVTCIQCSLTNTQPNWSFYSALVPLLEVDCQPEWNTGVHGRIERSKVTL